MCKFSREESNLQALNFSRVLIVSLDPEPRQGELSHGKDNTVATLSCKTTENEGAKQFSGHPKTLDCRLKIEVPEVMKFEIGERDHLAKHPRLKTTRQLAPFPPPRSQPLDFFVSPASAQAQKKVRWRDNEKAGGWASHTYKTSDQSRVLWIFFVPFIHSSTIERR